MSSVIIHKKGGGSFEIPEANLENTRRLLGATIESVEYKDKAKLEKGFIESLGVDEVVVEVIENHTEKKGLTMADLLNTDKDVLREMADRVSEDKGIAKANGRAGIEKLAEYIFLATN